MPSADPNAAAAKDVNGILFPGGEAWRSRLAARSEI